MSGRDDLIEAAGEALARHADAGPAHSTSRQTRASTIAAMERALRERGARTRRRQTLGRLALAAAALIGVGGATRLGLSLTHGGAHASAAPATVSAEGRWAAGDASIERAGQRIPFEGAHLAAGDRVETSAGAHAEIALSTGTTVVLSPAATVTWAGTTGVQAFDLARGTVSAHVAKLAPGSRFLVRTSDAEVEVHGTVFDVELATPDASCGDGTPTRVRVREGVVTVRAAGRESRIAAGEVWPAGCLAVAGAPTGVTTTVTTSATTPTDWPTAPEVATAPRATPTATPTATKVAAPSPTTTAPVDTLGAKNDLFAHALSARRHGDLRGALDGFESYLAQYPSGELAESASAQRMELLRKLDPSRATKAARDYLARWPAGFARADAQSLVSTPEGVSAAPTP